MKKPLIRPNRLDAGSRYMYNPYFDGVKNTYCPKCNAVIPLGIKNCPECQAEMTYTDKEKRELHRWEKRQVFLAIMFSILAFGAAGFIFFRG